MILTTQKQTEQQLIAEEFRALGRHNRPTVSAETVAKYRAFVASWLSFRRTANSQRLSAKRLESWLDSGARRRAAKVGAKVCWLILANGEIAMPNGGQPMPENVTTRESRRRLVSTPEGFIGAPSDPNENREPEPKFSRYLYHTDKSSRKIRVAVRENGVPIKIRETEREILRRRAEMERVVPFFEAAKEERKKKRNGESHDEKMASLCERLPPSPRITREIHEADKITQPDEQELPVKAQQLLKLLQKKLGQRNGYLVFDCLRCGCSIRRAAEGVCAESSLRSWIVAVK